MPTRYDAEDDVRDSAHGDDDREISLGTGTVLAIFLALALVCSLFFGLGYSMGRRSAAPAALAASAASPSPASPATGKPSPGSFATDRLPRAQTGVPAESAADASPDLQVVQPVAESSTGDRAATTPKPAKIAAGTVPSPKEIAITPAASSATVADIFVQIAAVSRKEDADLLMSALRRRGYGPVIRPQTQDKLLHVQVGPFATRKDAEAMRQHLITDGYNPILK